MCGVGYIDGFMDFFGLQKGYLMQCYFRVRFANNLTLLCCSREPEPHTFFVYIMVDTALFLSLENQEIWISRSIERRSEKVGEKEKSNGKGVRFVLLGKIFIFPATFNATVLPSWKRITVYKHMVRGKKFRLFPVFRF